MTQIPAACPTNTGWSVIKLGGDTIVPVTVPVMPSIPQVPQVTVPVTTIAGETLGSLGKASLVLGATWAAYQIGADVYDRYLDKFDSKIIEKFNRVDCGGLLTMPVKVEGCYRDYVRDAIYRLSKQAPWETTDKFYARFNACFEKRPIHSCSWWGEDVFN